MRLIVASLYVNIIQFDHIHLHHPLLSYTHSSWNLSQLDPLYYHSVWGAPVSFNRVIYRNMSEGLFTGTWAPCTTKEMCLLGLETVSCLWMVQEEQDLLPRNVPWHSVPSSGSHILWCSLFHGVLWALVGGSSSIPFRVKCLPVQSWVPFSYHHAYSTCCQHVTTKAWSKHNLNCCNKCKYM